MNLGRIVKASAVIDSEVGLRELSCLLELLLHRLVLTVQSIVLHAMDGHNHADAASAGPVFLHRGYLSSVLRVRFAEQRSELLP